MYDAPQKKKDGEDPERCSDLMLVSVVWQPPLINPALTCPRLYNLHLYHI